MRSRGTRPQILFGDRLPAGLVSREKHSRKAKLRQPLIAERKALRRHRGPRLRTDQRSLFGLSPRSCIRFHSQEYVLKRTKIVLALPSYSRQRLSGIGRGWCPWRSRKEALRVFRSDLWRSSPPVVKCAPFISATHASQGETATRTEARKVLSRLENWRVRDVEAHSPDGVPDGV